MGGVFTILVLLPVALQAQHSNKPTVPGKALIQKQGFNQLQLPAQAVQRIQKFSKNSIHKAVHPVQLPERLYEEEKLILYVNPNNNRIQFTPGKGAEEVYILKTSIDVPSDDRYVWAGDVFYQSSEHPIGSATFVQNNDGETTGNIDVEGVFFQIHPLSASGMHALVEFDREEIDRHDAAKSKNGNPNLYGVGRETKSNNTINTESSIPPTLDDSLKIESRNLLQTEHESITTCALRYIRALVLYTPNAATYGNIDNIIDLAIAETNQAYTNSNITNLRLVLQHKQEYDFIEGTDIEDALNDRLIPDPEIIQLRDSVHADVVIMLTEAGNYTFPHSGNCNEQQCPEDNADDKSEDWGIAGTLFLEKERAYAIVDVSKATGPTYTLAHELGHLQAARHHPDEDDDPALFDYAYGHRFSYECTFLGIGNHVRDRRSWLGLYQE